MSYLNLSCWEKLYSHKLRSRSEISKAARRFAKLNLPKAQQPLDRTNSFFDHDFACDSSLQLPDFRNGRDIFRQSVSNLEKTIALYAAGFPCQPYSCLHNHSEMLADKNSAQMWRCLENVAKMKPAVT